MPSFCAFLSGPPLWRSSGNHQRCMSTWENGVASDCTLVTLRVLDNRYNLCPFEEKDDACGRITKFSSVSAEASRRSSCRAERCPWPDRGHLRGRRAVLHGFGARHRIDHRIYDFYAGERFGHCNRCHSEMQWTCGTLLKTRRQNRSGGSDRRVPLRSLAVVFLSRPPLSEHHEQRRLQTSSEIDASYT